MTAFEVVQILFMFGTFVIALIGLCYKIFKDQNKKGCILNPGHGKIPAPDFNFYMQKDKYPI